MAANLPRCMRNTKFLIALGIALIVGIPFLLILGRGETLGPWDAIRPMVVAGAPLPTEPWDVLQADACLQFYVWRDLVFEAWRNGTVAFWNPYVLAGTPLLANSQSGVLYPLHIVMGVLRVPTGLAIVLLAWFHCAWAALGVALVGRKLGGETWACVAAGIAFGLSPFFMAWAPLGSVTTTVAWVPWIIACGIGVLRSPQPREWGCLAASIAMMLLAGHLQFAAFGLMGAMLFLAIYAGFQRAGKGFVWVVAATALGGCLAAPQILPVLEFSKFSHRQTAPTEEGFTAYRRTSMGPPEFVGLLDPRFLGNPRVPDPAAPIPGLSEFRPIRTVPGANYAEFAIGFGVALCALLMFVRRVDRAVYVPLGAIGILGLLFATGHPALKAFYFGLPGWAATGSPTRGGILFLLAGALLATQVRVSNWKPVAAILSVVCVGSALWLPPTSGKPLMPSEFGMRPTTDRVAVVPGKWNMVVLPTAAFPPNLLAIARIRQLGGYDSLMHRETVAMMRDVNGQDAAPPENGNMMFVKHAYDIAKVAETASARVLERAAIGSVVETEVPNAKPVAEIDGKATEWSRPNDSEIVVQTTGPGTLIVRERAILGWTATIDGKPAAVEASGLWISVNGIESGTHTVRLQYIAPGYQRGLMLFFLGLAGFAATIFAQKLAFRRHQ